jgi:branched-chain amino acid transport system substrate-binding protein
VHALDGHRFNDMFAHDGEFRASDHAVVHDLYVVKVKPSAALTEPHGWYDVLATIPAATAFPDASGCKMPS